MAASALHFNSGNKVKFVIFKITNDEQKVVLVETGFETDYEIFRQKLLSAVNGSGKPEPRYAIYDVDYDLGVDGKRYVWLRYPILGVNSNGSRTKTVFISWVPQNSPIKVSIYSVHIVYHPI